ncbi:MAG: CorA family divalent cation transporter [Eubacteriales bacterium]|nr:CorA family divalent cation transporter [Eubacteriales bacterium]
MKQYVLDTAFRVAARGDESADVKRVILATAEEFRAQASGLTHKKAMLHDLARLEYSKAELFGRCILGTVCIPPRVDRSREEVRLGFYLTEKELYLLGDEAQLTHLVGRMQELQFAAQTTTPGFFCLLLNSWMDDDVGYLQQIEDALEQLEETLLDRIPPHFYEALIPYRKRLMGLQSYYYQMMNLGVAVRANTNGMLDGADCQAYGYFADRAERVHHHVEMLCDYALQIREMHQTQVAVRQSKAMNLLAVVSAVFLPLTLLVGWYGMNFANMPELKWLFGYPAVIAASIAIVVVEILFFRRKHML